MCLKLFCFLEDKGKHYAKSACFKGFLEQDFMNFRIVTDKSINTLCLVEKFALSSIQYIYSYDMPQYVTFTLSKSLFINIIKITPVIELIRRLILLFFEMLKRNTYFPVGLLCLENLFY